MTTTKAMARTNAKGLATLRDKMEKRYGETRISRRERVKPYEVISTGSLSLDLALRVGGWAEGRIHEIVGQEGVGKTSLAINSMAEAQIKHPHLAVGYIDMEQTFDWDWAERNRLISDDDHFLHVYPEDSEDVSDQVRMMMATGLFKMIVVDSIGGMESRQAFTKEAEEAVVGRNAQIITRMSKRLAVDANKHQCAALLINQYRANIGNPKGRDLTAGPKSLKYATTTKVELSRTSQTPLKYQFPGDDEAQVVGKEVRARVTRNKVAAEGKKAEFWLINQDTPEFGPVGIDQASEALTIGLYTGVISQDPGGYYSLPWTKDKKDRLRGRPTVLDFLRSNQPKMLEVRDKSVEILSSDVKMGVEAIVETEQGPVDISTGEVL